MRIFQSGSKRHPSGKLSIDQARHSHHSRFMPVSVSTVSLVEGLVAAQAIDAVFDNDTVLEKARL